MTQTSPQDPLTHRVGPYKQAGKSYLRELALRRIRDEDSSAPKWLPRRTEEVLAPWPAKKPPEFLNGSGIGQWLAALDGLARDLRLPMAQKLDEALRTRGVCPAEKVGPLSTNERRQGIFTALCTAEQQLNKRRSSLEEIVNFKSLTQWLCEQVHADYHAAQFVKGHQEGVKFHKRILHHAQHIQRMLTEMEEAQEAAWDQAGASTDLEGKTFGDIEGMHECVRRLIAKCKVPLPSDLKAQRRRLQQQMLKRGGPRLWIGPLVWVDVIGFAATILKKRGITARNTYSLLQAVWPTLFPLWTDAFPTTLKTFYDQTARW